MQLEGIVSGTLTFLAIGYVSNPRNAGGVRSDLLFTILAGLRDAGLALSPPATTAVAPYVPDASPGAPSTAPRTPVDAPQPQGAASGGSTAAG